MGCFSSTSETFKNEAFFVNIILESRPKLVLSHSNSKLSVSLPMINCDDHDSNNFAQTRVGVQNLQLTVLLL